MVFSVLGVVVILLLFVVGCTASAFCGQRASAREAMIYSKPDTPTAYNEEAHIRPFRITIDNPFDAMQPELIPALQNNNFSRNNIQGDKRTRASPRTSVDENTHFVRRSTSPTTPSPRPSPRLSVAAIQTDIAPIISIINESGEAICEARGATPSELRKAACSNVIAASARKAQTKASPTQTQPPAPQITWF